MVTTTAAGTKLAISAGVPATQDAAGYAALTYTEISGIESLGVIGATTDKVEFQPLNGEKEKHKGPTDYGSLQPKMAYDKADAGQILLRTAAEPDNHALYAVKVTYPNGDVRYSQGRVFGFPESVEGAGSVITATPTIELIKKVVKVNAA